MNKIFLGVGALVVGIIAWFILRPDSAPAPATPTSQIVRESGAGRYLEYSPAVLAETSDQRRVLFFYANWCPTCRPADADLRTNETRIPADVRVIRINYNDSETDPGEKTLAEKYQITYQHTFVQIDADGNPVTSWNGGDTRELLNNLQ